MDALPLYTLGHSDRSQDVLVALLREHCIQAVVDIRAQPHSGRFPHFSDQIRNTWHSKQRCAVLQTMQALSLFSVPPRNSCAWQLQPRPPCSARNVSLPPVTAESSLTT
jgi:hypothetical protein